jgi:hypothetical protein
MVKAIVQEGTRLTVQHIPHFGVGRSHRVRTYQRSAVPIASRIR